MESTIREESKRDARNMGLAYLLVVLLVLVGFAYMWVSPKLRVQQVPQQEVDVTRPVP